MNTKTKLNEKAHIFVAVLLSIQPLMDILSYWLDQFGISDKITLILRMAVLAFTVIYSFIISDRKWVYYIMFGILAVLYAGHLFAIYQAGIISIFTDFSNFVRVVQMPVTAICLISCLKQNKKAFEGLQTGAAVALIIILAVMIISTLTGTDPGMYKNGTNFYNTGIRGWFYNTNSQSSNLCVLLPIALVWMLTQKNRKPMLILTVSVLGLLAMFFACTRLAYLGILAVALGIGVMIFILRRTDWKYGIFFLALAIIFVALVPYSPMTAHLNIHDDAQEVRQDDLVEKIEDPDEVKNLLEKKKKKKNKTDKAPGTSGSEAADEDDGELSEEEYRQLVEQLTPVYEYYIGDFVQIFGLEETMEMYDYTTDVKALSALRAKKLTFANAMLERSPFTSTLFGLEYGQFTVSHGAASGERLVNSTGEPTTEVYDVENDFHGIFYLYGWAGLAAYLAFIVYFIVLIIIALVKNIKKYFTLEAVSFGIALILCLAHAYNTAGVLRRPNASIFLSLVLAGVYYLVKIKEYDEGTKLPKITDIFSKKGK